MNNLKWRIFQSKFQRFKNLECDAYLNAFTLGSPIPYQVDTLQCYHFWRNFATGKTLKVFGYSLSVIFH